MKDLYSFHTSEADLDAFYDQVVAAYQRIYDRVGLGEVTLFTFASGGIFSKYSHEFQTLLPVGEDTIYYKADKSLALNQEVLLPEVLDDLHLQREELTEASAAEVGNIFKLKTKFSAPLDLKYSDQNNQEHVVYMGCYGIGISRLMGTIAEYYADDKGLVWPESVTPFKYHLIAIGDRGIEIANSLYQDHPELFLYDDRSLRPGEKFADADLIGIPHRIVISDKTLAQDSIELTSRSTGQSEFIPLEKFKNTISSVQ